MRGKRGYRGEVSKDLRMRYREGDRRLKKYIKKAAEAAFFYFIISA